MRLGRSIEDLAAESERRERYRRVYRATFVLLAVLATGTSGYYYLTDGGESILDCLYMTVITVSTVGYGEVVSTQTEALKGFTMALILFGGGSIVYFLSAITAIVIEGDLLHRLYRQRIAARLRRLRGHVILAGAGRTGSRVLAEFAGTGVKVVVVDEDQRRLEEVVRELGHELLFIHGDALDEATLLAAGIERAMGLVTTLTEDQENLFLGITALQLNPNLQLVSRVEEADHVEKFFSVGASYAVSSPHIGGRRLVHELLRPGQLAFTDAVMTTESRKRVIAEVPIRDGCPSAGMSLADARLEPQSGCLVLGLRDHVTLPYRYQPPSESTLAVGGGVMALGTNRQLARLRRLLGAPGTVRRAGARSQRAGNRRAQRGFLMAPVDESRFRIVVAGGGTLGIHAVREIRRLGGRGTVVVERDPERAEQLAHEFGADARVVVGSALDEHTLMEAGIGEATSIIAALRRDRDNLFLCLTARQLNPDLRMVSRVESPANANKLRTVGVSAVVSPATTGGRRLAYAILRPELAMFSEALIEAEERERLLAVIPVEKGAPLAQQRLSEADIHGRTGCAVIGASKRPRGPFRFRPPVWTRLRPGTQLVVLGAADALDDLRRLLSAAADPDAGES